MPLIQGVTIISPICTCKKKQVKKRKHSIPHYPSSNYTYFALNFHVKKTFFPLCSKPPPIFTTSHHSLLSFNPKPNLVQTVLYYEIEDQKKYMYHLYQHGENDLEKYYLSSLAMYSQRTIW